MRPPGGSGRVGASSGRTRTRNRKRIGAPVANSTARSHGADGVAAGAEHVDHAEHVDERREPVEVAPALRADAAAEVEREPEQRGEVAGDDAEAGEDGLVVHRERDEQPDRARVQPRVAEQRDRRARRSRRGRRARGARAASRRCGRGRAGSPSRGRAARRARSARTRRRPRRGCSATRRSRRDPGSSCRHPQVRRARGSAQPQPGARAAPTRSTRPVVVDEHAAARGAAAGARRPARAAARPWRASRRAARSARARWPRSARSTRASPVAGSSRWWAGAAAAPRQTRRASPDVATPPPRDAQRRGRLARERVLDGDVERRGAGRDRDAQVAAAVDDERAARRPSSSRGGVGGEALGRAAGVEAQPGRPRDRARRVVDRAPRASGASPRGGRGRARRRARRARAARSARGAPASERV